jgi:MFS family permease
MLVCALDLSTARVLRCTDCACIQILQIKLKCSDFLLVRIGLIGMAVAFMFISFFENIYCFFGACVMLGFGGLISPAAMSIVSIRTSDKDQGLAQGAFSANTSLSSILAQVTFDALFILGNTQYNSAGFAFYFAFAFCLIALACAVGFERTLSDEKETATDESGDINQSLIGQSMVADDAANNE